MVKKNDKVEKKIDLTPLSERGTCCKSRYTVQRGAHLKATWEEIPGDKSYKVIVEGIKIGSYAKIGEAYSFFGRKITN